MRYKRKKFAGIYFPIPIKKKDFSKISPTALKKNTTGVGIFLLIVFLIFFFEVYIPVDLGSHETVTYTVEKGWGNAKIADDLKELGLIRSGGFFKFYALMSLQHSSLQAGKYNLSSKMSAYQIAKKMANGDIIKNKLIILEGWDLIDIAEYLESKKVCSQEEFFVLSEKDYSESFDFLKSKPNDVSLEGFLFPDTYEVSETEKCEEVVTMMLGNFGKKLTLELREEIAKQGKTIFDVVTIASMLEKEVRGIEDKKTVSGILWKRLSVGMPLQIDATVNYVTGKSDPAVLIRDTKIDSPYNTYKYKGLPKGPISSPGADSILAAIYPKESNYWFYLSNGKTFFSETLTQHNIAKAQYLR
ncbi:MAG: endolytic transglycosylase MltG [Candidatus Staskawiczbacteria bacterium]|nr:endolytic transglycosylase MltG [Candidatus Staskawiczbacteria bacterium]